MDYRLKGHHQGVKTKLKTTHKLCNHIIHFDLIGVKRELIPKFLSVNGGNPRRKEQNLSERYWQPSMYW